MGREIVGSPHVIRVIRLPREVIEISTGFLLAFEFNRLRRVAQPSGNIKFKIVFQVAQRFAGSVVVVLDKPISIFEGTRTANTEQCGTAVRVWARDATRHAIARTCTGTAGVAA